MTDKLDESITKKIDEALAKSVPDVDIEAIISKVSEKFEEKIKTTTDAFETKLSEQKETFTKTIEEKEKELDEAKKALDSSNVRKSISADDIPPKENTVDEFRKTYRGMSPEEKTNVDKAYFNQKFGLDIQ